MTNRNKEITAFYRNKLSKCLHCGTFPDIKYLGIVFNNINIKNKKDIIKYINAAANLPSINTWNSAPFEISDSKIDGSTTIGIKNNNFVKTKKFDINNSSWDIIENKYNKTEKTTRSRYYVKNGKNKFFLEDSIFICKCTRKIWVHPRLHAIQSYSVKPGYDNHNSKLYQYIINCLLRRIR